MLEPLDERTRDVAIERMVAAYNEALTVIPSRYPKSLMLNVLHALRELGWTPPEVQTSISNARPEEKEA